MNESAENYITAQAAADVAAHGIQLEIVRIAEAKHGFVLLRRWVVKHSFAWLAKLRRLVQDD